MDPTSRKDELAGNPDSLVADLAILREVLSAHAFPTSQERLMAACLARGEPARLLWRLAALSRHRTYHSPGEVLSEVRDGAATRGG